MTKEDYVSLEVAKKLMNKGFDEPCDKMLNEHEECYEYSCYTTSKKGFRNSDLCAYEVAIPTLYETQKWLREKHNIHLVTKCICFHKPTQHHDYKCEIYSLENNRGYNESDIYNTYEEALNAGILEALNYI